MESDIYDIGKTTTLHGEVLIFRWLWYSCNECNVFPNLNEISIEEVFFKFSQTSHQEFVILEEEFEKREDVSGKT